MARSSKSGLDYFPLDVTMDDKIELIEAKYGIIGFGVVIKLFQTIYKNGYFADVSEERLLLFKKRIDVDIDVINAIIKDCIKWELFDGKLHKKYSILTSHGIQKTYAEATKRRKEVNLFKEYLLVNGNILEDNVNIIPLNTRNGTQSKVKESRVNYKETFKIFYADYPMKKGKQKAESSWLKHRPDLDTCLKAIELQKAERKALEGDGQFCPPWKYPVTWLNQGCWEDEVSIDTPKSPAAPWARQDNMR